MPRTITAIAVLLVGIAAARPLCAQENAQPFTLHGRLIDTQSQPIGFATVVLTADSTGRERLAFALADAEGRFELKAPSNAPAAGWVTGRYIGYHSATKRIAITRNAPSVVLALSEKNEKIGTVYIEGKLPDMEVRSDTVVFNPVAYTTGGESTLGDVIRKMPGMQVDEEGNARYEGKEIGKVLINGRDVLASGNVAMQTLSPDFAHSVELLRNYNDDDIAHSFRSKRQTALNLKSKRKLNLNGTLEAGGGIQRKYQGKASLLSLLPQVSLTSMANTNNTGSPVYSIEQHLKRTLDDQSGKAVIQLDGSEAALLRPPENEYRRRGTMGNLSLVWNPTKKYKLTTNSLYHNGQADGDQESLLSYLLPNGSLNHREQSAFSRRNAMFSQHINHKWKATERFTLRAKTTADYRTAQADRLYMLEREADRVRAARNGQTRYVDASQSLLADILVGKGWINISGRALFRDFVEGNNIRANLKLLPLPYSTVSDSDLPHALRLKRMGTDLRTEADAGLVYPLRWGINLKGNLFHGARFERTRTPVAAEPYAERTTRHRYGSSVGVMKNRGYFQFDAGVSAARYDLTSSSPRIGRKHLLALEPHVDMTLEFSKQHRLEFNSARSFSPASLIDMLQSPWASEYSHIVLPSRLSTPFAEQYDASLHYIYLSILKHLMLFANVRYNHYRNKPLVSSYIEVPTSSSYMQDGGWQDGIYASLNLVQGLGSIPIDAKANLSANRFGSNILNNGQPDVISMLSYTGELALTSRFVSFPLNFDIEGSYSDSRTDLLHSQSRSRDQQFSYAASLHLKVAPFTLSLTGKMQQLRNIAHRRRFWDIDAMARYTYRGFTFTLSGVNLLHLRENSWSESYATAYLQSSTLFHRLPGYLLLTMGYKF